MEAAFIVPPVVVITISLIVIIICCCKYYRNHQLLMENPYEYAYTVPYNVNKKPINTITINDPYFLPPAEFNGFPLSPNLFPQPVTANIYQTPISLNNIRTGINIQQMCSICIDARTDLRLSPCGHQFHIKCFVDWSHRQRKCPNCNNTNYQALLKCNRCGGLNEPALFCPVGCQKPNHMQCFMIRNQIKLTCRRCIQTNQLMSPTVNIHSQPLSMTQYQFPPIIR